MKLFKSLTGIAVALIATCANANTTNVTTAQLIKVQPINTLELVKTVEVNLASSMKQLKVSLAPQTFTEQTVSVETTDVTNKKLLATKLVLAAE